MPIGPPSALTMGMHAISCDMKASAISAMSVSEVATSGWRDITWWTRLFKRRGVPLGLGLGADVGAEGTEHVAVGEHADQPLLRRRP